MTPQGLAVVRGTKAALWHPDDNTWEELPTTDRPLTDLHASGSTLISASGHARLDLGDDEWRALPDLPLDLERSSSTWFADGLFVIGGPGSAFVDARAFRYDLAADAWTQTASPPAGLHAEALASDWDGRRVVVANYDMRAATYDPATDRWSELPDIPARFYEGGPTLISTNRASIVFMVQAVVTLTPDDTWIPLPYGSIPRGQFVSTSGIASD
jgi:hypothetical protein